MKKKNCYIKVFFKLDYLIKNNLQFINFVLLKINKYSKFDYENCF